MYQSTIRKTEEQDRSTPNKKYVKNYYRLTNEKFINMKK